MCIIVVRALGDPGYAHSLEEMTALLSSLQMRFHLTKKQLLELLATDDIYIPCSIFSEHLSSLESIVVYLRDYLLLKNKEIAKLLARDERSISTTYHHGKEKLHARHLSVDFSVSIPASIIAERKLSVLESIAIYLKQKKCSVHDIAAILHRNYRTIWTVIRRAEAK